MEFTRRLTVFGALLVLCSSCGDGPVQATAVPEIRASLHEHELAGRPHLRGSFSGTVTGRLEAGDREPHPNDTAAPGLDEIPYLVEKPTTLCVTLEPGAIAEASIHHEGGAPAVRLDDGSTAAKVTLQPGEHTLRLTSSGSRDAIFFVRPAACDVENESATESRAALSFPSPGVYIHTTPDPHTIQTATTSITAFVGYAATGPTGTATLLTSISDFTAMFGPVSASTPLSLAVEQFFQYGGSVAYVVGTGAASGPTPTTDDLLPAGALAGEASLATVDYDLLVLPDLALMSEPDALEVISYATGLAETSNAFFLMDYPLTLDTAEEIREFVTSDIAGLTLGAAATHTALYFPPVGILLPTGGQATVGLGGILAGILARVAEASGVWTQPAGVENGALLDVTLPLALDDTAMGELNALSINPIRPATGGEAPAVWGSRTLGASGADFAYIAERRLMTMVTKSITQSLTWVVFDVNDGEVRRSIELSVGAFLNQLWTEGALFGTTSADAYVVTCDETNNPPERALQGLLRLDIGIAAMFPGEFVTHTFEFQTTSSS